LIRKILVLSLQSRCLRKSLRTLLKNSWFGYI